jgi:hypothetical protein
MTTVIQAHLIAALFILPRPGQPVKDFAEQVAHPMIPLPSLILLNRIEYCIGAN